MGVIHNVVINLQIWHPVCYSQLQIHERSHLTLKQSRDVTQRMQADHIYQKFIFVTSKDVTMPGLYNTEGTNDKHNIDICTNDI